MIYKITVREGAESGRPVPGATVTFSSSVGTLVQLVTGANGIVTIDDSQDGGLLQPGIAVRVTAPGYSTAGSPASDIVPDTYYIIDKSPNILTAVVVGLALGWLLLSKKR